MTDEARADEARTGEACTDEARADGWLGGRLSLRQPARHQGHRAGTDALLLAAALSPRPGALVCDVGAATGAVGLALAARCPEARVLLVERDPALCAMAAQNVRANVLATRVDVACADILATRRVAGLPAGTADAVLTNPPYLDPSRHRASSVPARADAHVLPGGDLAGWVRACARLLRPGGHLVAIHRADALGPLLSALGTVAGALRVLPIHPRGGAPATRLLVAGIKGRRSPTVLLPGLSLHDASGAFTPEVAAIQRGEAGLNL